MSSVEFTAKTQMDNVHEKDYFEECLADDKQVRYKTEMKDMKEALSKKENENNHLQKDIRKCQSNIIKMLKEEVLILKSDNTSMLNELQNIKAKLAPNTQQQTVRNIQLKVHLPNKLDLDNIKRKILFGEAPKIFQRCNI